MAMAAWLLWTLVALLSWGVWAVLSKLLGDTLSAEQTQAISTLGLLPILVVLALSAFSQGKRWGTIPRRDFVAPFLGGIVSCLGNLFYYGALARGEKVSAIVALTALYPLMTIGLAVLLLRERLNLLQLAGIVFSLIAIWLFNDKGDGGLLSKTVLYAVPPIVLWGLSGFLQKVSTNHLPAEGAALIYLGAFVPVGVAMGLSEPWPAVMTSRTWWLVLAVGFFLAFGNYAILAAFARGGKAAVITPLSSLYPLISVPVAVIFLHEKLGEREVTGILLAILSVAAFSIEWPGKPGAAPAAEPRPQAPGS